MVQQAAFTFPDVLQLVEQVGELLHVEAIDLADLGLLLFVLAVMRQVVMAFRHADERVARLLPSLASMKVVTRVRSAWNASAIMSHISRTCCW